MTLGIPRLKEILMTTPHTIKTPCMTVFFNKDATLSSDQMLQLANSYERLKFSDVVKKVDLGQSISKGPDGVFNRVYKLTLEFDDAKKLKSKLGIKFSHLCKVFSDKFVPQLMTETLKELRRSAEIELSGPKNSENTNDLKKVLSKTVKATKVSKNSKNEDDQQNPEEGPSRAESDSESNDDKAEDQVMDIDGHQKNKQTNYDNSDSEAEATQ